MREIFQIISSYAEYKQPPAYNECCDRTEGFCEVPEEPSEEELEEERGPSLEQPTVPDSGPLGEETADATSQLSVEATIGRKEG